MEELTNGKSIGAFLMSARQRLQPEMVGLSRTQRRRTSGLRREEVAERANIGVSWYTSIEQGKIVHPSIQVLNSIADALLLTTLEKNYLINLANLTESHSIVSEELLPTGMRDIVATLDPNPAYILNESWDIVAWNNAANLIFDYSSFDREKKIYPNLLKHFLLSNHMKAMIDDWENRSKVMVDRYKADYLKQRENEDFLANIEFLEEESPLFKEEWNKNNIEIINNSTKNWQHPLLGEVVFEQIILTTPELDNYQIFVFIADEQTKRNIRAEI